MNTTVETTSEPQPPAQEQNSGQDSGFRTVRHARNSDRPKIRISLKRTNGTDWQPAESRTPNAGPSTAHEFNVVTNAAMAAPTPPSQNPDSNSILDSGSVVAASVSSFFNGIRASFRQENVYVASNVHAKRGASKSTNENGK